MSYPFFSPQPPSASQQHVPAEEHPQHTPNEERGWPQPEPAAPSHGQSARGSYPPPGYPDPASDRYPAPGYGQYPSPGYGQPAPGPYHPATGGDWTGTPASTYGQPPATWARHDPGWQQNATQYLPTQSGYPGPSTAPAPQDEQEQQERQWALIRRDVASRLKTINSTHCHEAFDRLGRRNALGPHGVLLFWAAPDDYQPSGYRLMIATRLFLACPESDDLTRILDDLHRSATDNITRARTRSRRWDPRGPEGSMVNGGDTDMPDSAVFIGTGVTTLDTEQGSWHTIAHAIRNQSSTMPLHRSVFDLTGQGIALLTDGSALHVVRDPNRRIGDTGITCNRSLDPHHTWGGHSHSDITERGDHTIRSAWGRLATLHHTLQDYLTAGQHS